eukprot:CAMPEP_0195108612 /NCGR_PEP_ID=MMETSP0448-20130528/85908_1 /TAXON_ID=66468 /ORGANISM="Heterocapsa triquestra, Strain CCMP 448" /LENGTH=162 /DNA_ID=CAMNT_0040145157 /DNA_START=42 /DNA_END=530 /DNA_ORIENTATION=+
MSEAPLLHAGPGHAAVARLADALQHRALRGTSAGVAAREHARAAGVRGAALEICVDPRTANRHRVDEVGQPLRRAALPGDVLVVLAPRTALRRSPPDAGHEELGLCPTEGVAADENPPALRQLVADVLVEGFSAHDLAQLVAEAYVHEAVPRLNLLRVELVL